MTNKKFKLAAMSMALTACVAAQPMIANAAETGDVQEPVSNTNESSTSPQSAPADENDSVQSGEDGGAGASAEEKKEDGVNQEADKTEEAFGEDVDISYDPATKTEDPDTGSSTIKGDVVKKDEDKGESEDKSESEGESEEKNESEGDGETGEKKDEESEKIGDATKTETPDPDGTVTEDPVPKPGGESKTESKTGVDEDGNTTITNTTTTEGTQTSTSTGSGHAEADTKEETETKKEDIDLKDELGGAEIDWDVKRDADVGDTGYKVASVETIEDGKQTLTLKKVDSPAPSCFQSAPCSENSTDRISPQNPRFVPSEAGVLCFLEIIFAGADFYYCRTAKPAGFVVLFFHRKSRDGKRHLSLLQGNRRICAVVHLSSAGKRQ